MTKGYYLFNSQLFNCLLKYHLSLGILSVLALNHIHDKEKQHLPNILPYPQISVFAFSRLNQIFFISFCLSILQSNKNNFTILLIPDNSNIRKLELSMDKTFFQGPVNSSTSYREKKMYTVFLNTWGMSPHPPIIFSKMIFQETELIIFFLLYHNFFFL